MGNEAQKAVVIASRNPVKERAARIGFERMFAGADFIFESLSVPSGVSDQPLSGKETLAGAEFRAESARRAAPNAEYWVGIEGGVEEIRGDLMAFAWVVILSKDRVGRGQTAGFFLPPRVAELVRQGKELGEADDLVFGQQNSKQKNGAIGLLTDDALDRTQLYEPAVLMALIPFKKTDLYPALKEE